MQVEKNNPIVNKINKSKREDHPDLYKIQQDRLREIQMEKKQHQKQMEKQQKLEALQRKKEKEERSYDRIMNEDEMQSNADIQASVDNSAAEAYEEDFF